VTDDVLTVSEAAELLRCSEETIRIKARDGSLPALKIGGWKFLRSDLLRLFAPEPTPSVQRRRAPVRAHR